MVDTAALEMMCHNEIRILRNVKFTRNSTFYAF